jgi:hypothetical protein
MMQSDNITKGFSITLIATFRLIQEKEATNDSEEFNDRIILDTFFEMSENFSTDKEGRDDHQLELNPDLFPQTSGSVEIFDPGEKVIDKKIA